ncbi:ATP-binding protein [bacterium]|nr:ATP-binding protein [bacterium]
MDENFVWRIQRNTYLPKTKALAPLFEAVVNSLHATEEAGNPSNATIDVMIDRGAQASLMPNSPPPDITGFTIRDDGIGFTDEHFRSFNTTDTDQKAAKGGKGVGRLLWLKAFEQAAVDSVFMNGASTFLRRQFRFVLQSDPVQGGERPEMADGPRSTTVRLIGLREGMSVPAQADTIARHLLAHCLLYLLDASCPRLTVRDTWNGDSFSLNQMLAEMLASSEGGEFDVQDQTFAVRLIRLRSRDRKAHAIHYCADNRPVVSEKLDALLEDLDGNLLMDGGAETCVAVALVSSRYLDERVNAERTEFTIPKKTIDGNLGIKDLSWMEIEEAVANRLSELLADELKSLRQTKLHGIVERIQQTVPEWRYLTVHAAERLARLPPTLSDPKFEAALFQVSRELMEDTSQKVKAITSRDGAMADATIEADYAQLIDTLTAINEKDLAEYVRHRHAILDLLDQALRRQPDGKFVYEDRVHQIICPRFATSDDPEHLRQNLWLLDERLSYHRFLASDLPMSSFGDVEVASKKKPDIYITFDEPAVFAEGERPFHSVTIVEFKRPERSDYTEKDNPVWQVYEYIDLLRTGTVLDRDQRPIHLDDAIRFFCHIVATVNQKLVQAVRELGIRPGIDQRLLSGYSESRRAWVEIVDYDMLLANARLRNRMLFQKAGLPS